MDETMATQTVFSTGPSVDGKIWLIPNILLDSTTIMHYGAHY